MPNASWTVLKRIIRPYGAVQDGEISPLKLLPNSPRRFAQSKGATTNFSANRAALPEKKQPRQLGARLAMGSERIKFNRR